MIIGIPRTLTYYAYLPLWRAFSEHLKCEVLISDKTSRFILDKGVEYTVNDACIPIKLFHGHVYSLKDKVDFVFVPRLLNLTGEKNVTYCPKFLGLADMVKASIPDLPPLLDLRIDKRQKKRERKIEYERIASLLNVRPADIGRAFCSAQRQLLCSQKRLYSCLEPEEALRLLTGETGYSDAAPELCTHCSGQQSSDNRGQTNTPPRFGTHHLWRKIPYDAGYADTATEPGIRHRKRQISDDTGCADAPLQPITLTVVGYPYLLYDDFVNVGLISKLRKMKVRILTTEMVPEKVLRAQSGRLPKDLFWTFSNRVVWGSLHYIHSGKTDGIIHVTAFGCGPDSIVGKLIELEAKQKSIPYICVSVDEHTGEAGIMTRLEAFVDMLRYRRDIE